MTRAKIFIVEDEPLQILFLKSEFIQLGYELAGTAATGEEAVAMIRETKPDLLLLDIHLAGQMDGSDVAKSVKEFTDIPHIYITAYSNEETFIRTTVTNPSGYLLKPYTTTGLDFQIRLALKNAAVNRLVEERGEKLRALIEQSGDGIVLTDSSGRIVEWNTRAEEIIGLRKEEALALHIWDLQFRLLPKDRRSDGIREKLEKETRAMYESGRLPWVGALTELAIELPDGSSKTVQISTFRLEWRDDFQVCGIVRDISRQKEDEYDRDSLYLFLAACNGLGDSKLLIKEYCRLLEERFLFSGSAGFLVNERGSLDFIACEGSLQEELFKQIENARLLEDLYQKAIKGVLGKHPGVVPLGKGFYTLSTFPEKADSPKEREAPCSGVLNLVPIRSGNEHFGLLVFCIKEEERDLSKKINLLELTTDQLASTLKKFVNEQAIKEQNNQLSVRNTILLKASSSLDLDEILGLSLEVSSDALNADGGMVHLYDEQTKKLLLRRGNGMEDRLELLFRELSLSDSIIGFSAALGYTIIVDDLSLEKGKVPEEAVEKGWRSIICTPLKREEKLYGVLTLFSVKRGRFDKGTSDLMNAVGKHIAMAIENGFLYRKMHTLNEDLERRVQERTTNLEVLNQIAQNLNYVLDYRQLFTLLFSHLWSVMRFDVAVGVLLDEEAPQVFASRTRGITDEVEKHLRTRIENAIWNLSGSIKAVPTSLLVVAEAVPFDPLGKITTLTSYYEAPFYYEDELIAYLMIGAERRDAFTENQVQLLNIVVNQASVLLKRLRDLLSSEKTRLEQLVEALPEGILLLNKENKTVIKNPAAETFLKEIFGASVPDPLTEIAGLPLEELTAREGKETSRTAELETRDNRFFSVTAVPISKGPDSGGTILSLQDITVGKLQEEQIKLRERLAAVGQLAAGIAHDFNNILTGIIGYSEYLQLRKDMTDAAKPYLRKIIEQSKRAGSLIQQILDFSRKSIAEFHSLDLVPFCKEMAKLFVRLISENIHISFETEEKSCVVRGDPTQIQQILTNLVVNSRDAMPGGGDIKITLQSYLFEEGEASPIGGLTSGFWARLSVADTGEGIPKDVLPRVFEPFFTTKEVGKGSGLGLAQVYGLVQQHKGHIGIESVVGRGTLVTIFLPMTPREDTEAEEVEDLSLPGRSEGVILLVEDEEGVREVTENVLREVGFTVHSAADGKDGLEIFESFSDKIELVLSDVVMPKMGGRELFREIKKLKPDVPFVFMTGHPLGNTDVVDEFQKATLILRKPLEFATLIRAINESLSAGGGSKRD